MTLSRRKLHDLFKRHHGSITRVADELGVTAEAVSRWLKGKNRSQRVESGVLIEAKKLLAKEAKNSALRSDCARAMTSLDGRQS